MPTKQNQIIIALATVSVVLAGLLLVNFFKKDNKQEDINQKQEVSTGYFDKDIQELAKNFTFKGKPIHPKLLGEFVPYLSDIDPTTVAVDIAANENGDQSDEYMNDDIASEDGSVTYSSQSEDPEYKDKTEYDDVTSYKWFGSLNNGIHAVELSESGGGSGVFKTLLLVKFEEGSLYQDGKERKQLLMKLVGTYGLGDRALVTITLDKEKNSVTLKGSDIIQNEENNNTDADSGEDETVVIQL